MPNPDTLPEGAEQEARRLVTDVVGTWASGPCDSTEELVASTECAILDGMRWAMRQQAVEEAARLGRMGAAVEAFFRVYDAEPMRPLEAREFDRPIDDLRASLIRQAEGDEQ